MHVLDDRQLELAREARTLEAEAKVARQLEAAQRRENARSRNLGPGAGGDCSGPARIVPPLLEGATWPTERLAAFGVDNSPTADHVSLVLAVDVGLVLASGHCSVLRLVPKQLQELWKSAMELCVELAVRDSTRRQTAGVALLMLLPALTLRFTPGQRTRGGSWNAMGHRLKRFLEGDWQNLLEELWADDRAARDALLARTAPPPGETARIRSLVKRAAALIAEGELSRGMSALESESGTAPLTQDVLEELRALHPEPTRPVAVTELRDFAVPDAKRIVITAEEVLHQLRGAPHRSAGGPSRLSFDHLREPAAASHTLLLGLTKLIQRLLDGAVPARVAAMLADSRLIALFKTNGKVRPIAIGDTIRRLAARVLLARLAARAQHVLLPLQLGAGARGGAEAIIHLVRAYLAEHPELTLFIFDYTNAFNCASRAKALEAVMADEELCAAVPYLRLFYSEAANLWLSKEGDDGRPERILSQEGTQQGDVFGPLLFALATLALVRRICRAAAGRGGLGVFYADDGWALVDDASSPAFFRAVVKESKKECSLDVNPSKTVALKLSGRVHPRLRQLGLRCIDESTPAAERGTDALGAPLGTDEFTAATLDGMVVKVRASITKLTSLLKGQPAAAAMLLRRCVAPRFLHLLRCCHPRLTAGPARAFTEALRAGELELAAPGVDVALSRAAELKLSLPGREGGFGLGDAEALAPVAYVSSVIAARPLACKVWPGFSGAVPLDGIAAVADAVAAGSLPHARPDLTDYPLTSAPLLAAVDLLQPASAAVLATACREMLSAEAGDAPGDAEGGGDDAAQQTPPPATPHPRGVHPAAGLQHRLAAPLISAAAAELRDVELAADPEARAQHLAETGFCGVGAWGSALPGGATDLDEDTFRVNMAWTLRLPFASFDGLRCRCGRVLTAEGAVAHVLSCGSMLSLHTGIHHTLGRGFDTIGLEAPGAPRIVGLLRGGAPAVGSWVDDNGVSHLVMPDRIITGVAGDGMPVRNILDFVCPNPARRSTVAAGTTKLAAVVEEHKKKMDWYKRPGLGLRSTDRIVPIAVDLFGGVHPSVVALLKGWADGRGGADTVHSARILRNWQVRLAVALAHARAQFISDALDALIPGASARVRRSVYDPTSFLERASDSGVPGRRLRRGAW